MAGSADVTSERLRAVLDAVATVTADVTMDGLLARIVTQAAELVDARHGYLDVLDLRVDRRMGSSATYGLDPDRVAGRHGREALVELLDSSMPFFGVPIRVNGAHFANIYLMDKRDGVAFDREDEEVAQALANAAAVVIENARLHEDQERQRRWLEAGAELTTTLLGPVSQEAARQLVADRTRDLARADFVALLMPQDASTLVVEAVSGVPGPGVLGERVNAEHSVAGDAARTGTTVVVPNTDNDPRYTRHKTPAWPDLGSVMVLPLQGSTERGAIVVGWLRGHRTDRWELDPVVPQRFADQAALVLQVAQAQADQGRLAVFEDRDRIGRDLHDLVIQRLFGIGLMLDNTTKLISSPEASVRLSSAIDELDLTIKDIRRAIFALGSGASPADLRGSLEQAVDHAAGLLGFRPDLRLSGPVDSVVSDDVREHVLAVVGEALSNVIRHADARAVAVELDVADAITLVVRDDGRGVDGSTIGTGMRNIAHRARVLGGSCDVGSRPEGGVELRWAIPRSAS
jgi:signal transduction histidine kinase